MCGETARRAARHVVDIESGRSSAPAGPAICSSLSEAAAGGKYRSVPERVRHDPDHAAGRRGLGRAADPGRRWRSSSSTPRSAGWWRATRAPPGRPSANLTWRPGTGWSPATRCLAAMTPDVEAVFVDRSEHGDEVFLVPIDDCYALVGELRRRWQGFDGGAEAHAALAAFLAGLRGRARRSRPRSAQMADLVFGCTGAQRGAVRRRPRRCRSRCTITESTGVPVHAIALRCQIRIEPQRRRYSAGRGGAAARPVRRHLALGRHAQADAARDVTTMVPALQRR